MRTCFLKGEPSVSYQKPSLLKDRDVQLSSDLEDGFPLYLYLSRLTRKVENNFRVFHPVNSREVELPHRHQLALIQPTRPTWSCPRPSSCLLCLTLTRHNPLPCEPQAPMELGDFPECWRQDRHKQHCFPPRLWAGLGEVLLHVAQFNLYWNRALPFIYCTLRDRKRTN